MNAEHANQHDPRIRRAIEELKDLIQRRYPRATFEVAREDDPDGIYLRATVEVGDIDEVVDVVIDRLLELQVEERLPVYVMPVRPLERVLEQLRQPRRKIRPRIELEGVAPAP